MATYRVKMEHSEATFVKLARKQNDVFHQKSKAVRTLIACAALFVGVLNFEQWWGIALTAYGCYMSTNTYGQANYTARKLAEQIREQGMSFPASEYVFRKNYMEIIILPEIEDEEPEQLKYKDLERIAEDREYFYLFRDQYGGYMVPKDQLNGRVDEFRTFLEKAAGQSSERNSAPWRKMLQWVNSPSKKK